MKTEASVFFRPLVNEQRGKSLDRQLAVELFVARLEVELGQKAEEAAGELRGQDVSRAAHMLENLVLRHPKMKEWQRYLEHEVDRKRSTEALARKILKWQELGADSPVSKAIKEARDFAQSKAPLSKEEEWREILGPSVTEAATREFLARWLGRLTK